MAEKTLEQCADHGRDHAAYNWTRRGLNFPGTPEQIAAYENGYLEQLEEEARQGNTLAKANLPYIRSNTPSTKPY